MILIYGSLHDEMIELMCARLTQLNFEFQLIDPFDSQSKYFTYQSSGNVIEINSLKILVKDISGIYARFVNVKGKGKIKSMSDDESMCINYESNGAFINFMDNFSGLVINRVMDSVSNDSKLYQLIKISAHGFFTPKTLITYNPANVIKFYNSCNKKIIFKSLSSIRSIVTKFTKRHFDELKLITNCPVQFQELIEGLEIRVHTIGKKIFATAIETDAIDYRYARKYNKYARFYPYELPVKIGKACLKLAETFGFAVAGIDLKKTKDDKFYCFEVNPSPAFIVYERMTGQPVSKEVAMMLYKGIRTC